MIELTATTIANSITSGDLTKSQDMTLALFFLGLWSLTYIFWQFEILERKTLEKTVKKLVDLKESRK